MKLKDEIADAHLRRRNMNPDLDGGKILIDAHAYIRLLDFHDAAVSALRHYDQAHRDTCDEVGNVAAPVLALLDKEVE